jgi:GGDEF domain-containing protein
VLRRAPAAFERRAVSRPFEEVLDHAASQSAAQGVTVSVVVLQLPEGGRRADLTQRLASRIRPNLRAGEPVGALTDGEIGMLLYDCAPDVVPAVLSRLRDSIGSGDGGATLESAAVGVAHCPPGSTPHQLVRAARAEAHSAQISKSGQAS